MEKETTGHGQKRSREDCSSSPEHESAGESLPEAKRLREELLFDILEDDTAAGDVNAGGDLATFMKSFEEEIGFSTSPTHPPAAAVVDSPSTAANGGQSYSLPPPLQQPDLGFLLEASDDELGLPPSMSEPSSSPEDSAPGDIVASLADSDEAGFGQIWGVEEDNGFGFDSEFGVRPVIAEGDGGVVFDGELFDYADAYSGPSDLTWRQETLPAV